MQDILFDFTAKYVSLTDDEKTATLSAEIFRSDKKGTILLKEGQKSKDSYFVIKGCIRTYYVLDGEEKTTAFHSKFPKLETLCRMISEELLAKQRIDFDTFKNSSPEQRYLNLLQKRPDLIQRVPQHQLASYLGMLPQSLSRLRARIIEKERTC